MIFKNNSILIKYSFVLLILFLYFFAWYADESAARAGRTSRSSSRSYSSSSRSSSRSYSSYSGYKKSYTSSYSKPYTSSNYSSGLVSGRRSYASSYGSGGYYSGGYSGTSYFTIFIIFFFLGIVGVVIYIIYKATARNQYYSEEKSYSYNNYGNSYNNARSFAGASGGGLEPFQQPHGNDFYHISNPQLEQRIHDIFMAVQNAWSSRNPYIAQRYMSARLFQEHSADINDMLSRGERNVLENIRVHQIRIVEAGPNFARAYITASMIDYYINEGDGSIMEGDNQAEDEFTELWIFIKNADGFVVDEITE